MPPSYTFWPLEYLCCLEMPTNPVHFLFSKKLGALMLLSETPLPLKCLCCLEMNDMRQSCLGFCPREIQSLS